MSVSLDTYLYLSVGLDNLCISLHINDQSRHQTVSLSVGLDICSYVPPTVVSDRTTSNSFMC